MFILNPDPYLIPDYKISPFQSRDIEINNNLPPDESVDDYFLNRFGHANFYYTQNGRHALYQVLKTYCLQLQDAVTIFTTSGNFYISSCVTGEVEKFCRWNREVDDNTKLILVIHEFGYAFENIESLKKYNLPIVEDCAYSFFTTATGYKLGGIGEFAIYSFPKMFPIQIGGLVASNKGSMSSEEVSIDWIKYMKSVLSFYISQQDHIMHLRLKNYHTLQTKLSGFGLEPRFALVTGMVPGVFMFKTDGKINLPALKEYLFKHGIQCSVFYGEESFFIPAHQSLTESDLNYIACVIESFITTVS